MMAHDSMTKEIIEVAYSLTKTGNVEYEYYHGAMAEELKGGFLYQNEALAIRRKGKALCCEVTYPFPQKVVVVDDEGEIVKMSPSTFPQVLPLLRFCNGGSREQVFQHLIDISVVFRTDGGYVLDEVVEEGNTYRCWKADSPPAYGLRKWFNEEGFIRVARTFKGMARYKLLDSIIGVATPRGVIGGGLF